MSDLKNMVAVGPVECRAWPKTAAQLRLCGQVRYHGGVATLWMHAFLAFFDEYDE